MWVESSDDELLSVVAYPRSPWEALSPSPSPSSGISDIGSVAQLAPEIEEGNVEYKLKLCNPTPERFTRLVTQLKWRLLAGTGQALYEIGVSDSGQLVGLSRKDLEDSLETLERMAGELGATVIVQKEVTMPVPCPPIDRRHAAGVMRMRKRTAEDIILLSPRDTDGSSDELAKLQKQPRSPVDSGVQRTTPNQHVRSSPQPIIRDFPYGQTPRIRSHGFSIKMDSPSSRTTASRFDPDDEIDDDAAFAFDLEIDSIAKSISMASVSTPVIDQSHFAQTSHHPKALKQTKHKVPEVPVDAVAKALHRRARRDAKRLQKRKELGLAPELLGTPPVPIGKRAKPKITVAAVEDSGDDATIVHRQHKAPKKSRVFNGEYSSREPAAFDPLAPRFIVEALIVRKFAFEESLLELDIHSFDG